MPRKDKSEKYNYLLRYVDEAVEARQSLKEICERTIKAYKKCPSRNTYKENAFAYKQNIANGNPELAECLDYLCANIPDATNDTVFNAVETWVSMTMGGASQFEYEPADAYSEKDAGLVDRLSALARFLHEDNKIDSLIVEAARDMVMQGQANFFLEPKEDGRFKVSLIDAFRMLQDPRSAKTNRSRFTGFTDIRSWSEVKAEIYKKNYGYMLKVINDVDQYISNLNGPAEAFTDEVREDLNTFSSIYSVHSTTSESVDDKGNPVSPKETGYKGDDVEVAYIYDLLSNVYAVIINRRFIVQAEEDKLKRTIDVKYYDENGDEKVRKDTVRLDSPIVTIPFIKASWETYPVSPLFYCLDDFDAICSIEAVMNHNLSIMAPITFISASSDAEEVSKLSQVAGQIVEGTLNTFGVMAKQHDMSPCISAVERKEQSIKRMLGATDQFELQAMIGNRATAAEVATTAGAVSQRLNAPLANIECGMSELTQKMFAMVLIYGKNDEIVFSSDGVTNTLSKEDLLGRALIRAKLASRIKLERTEQGRNALMVLQTLIGLEGINKESLVKTLVPIVTQGVVTRRQAETFIGESTSAIDQLNLQEALQQQVAAQSPDVVTPDMTQGMTPQDMGEISDAYSMSMSPAIDTGYENYQAGIEANMPDTNNIDEMVL